MKITNHTFLAAAFTTALLLGSGCTIDDQIDPNAPSINSISEGATLQQLNLLVAGLESEIRDGYEQYVTATGTVSRELYLFDADPRNTADLLNGQIDNNTFYLTAPFGAAYRVVKTANLLLDAVDNTDAVDGAAAQGYRGVANTFKAYALQRVLNMLGSNGIRVDVADPNNLGDFLSEDASLDAIAALYDEAAGQLSGAAFAFSLNEGFAGFDTPEGFLQFNRALAARTDLYREDWSGALEAVDASFYTEGMNPGAGPQFIFSTGPGDLLNPLFRIPGNTGNMIFAQPNWFEEAEEGDQRVANQVAVRDEVFVRDMLNGIYETRKYPTSNSPISIVDNEELHLIRAEALAQTGEGDDAVELINIVRSLAGLDDYDGDSDTDSLIDEILTQRRYSLWAEGHRFVDLRRYGRLNADNVPVDRDGDVVSTQFPIPLNEGV